MAFRTREQIERAFDVVDGVIRTPGRYEGEMEWAPFYDTLANEGDGESHTPQCQCGMTPDGTWIDDFTCDCVAWDKFNVDADEREMFSPYLDGVDNVWLWLDSQGFLIVKVNETVESLRRLYHGIAD